MIRLMSFGISAAVAAVALAAPAHAEDRKGFLDYIHSQGVPSQYIGGPGMDYDNFQAADMMCAIFRSGGTSADIGFMGMQAEMYRTALISGAQRFICPDTLK